MGSLIYPSDYAGMSRYIRSWAPETDAAQDHTASKACTLEKQLSISQGADKKLRNPLCVALLSRPNSSAEVTGPRDCSLGTSGPGHLPCDPAPPRKAAVAHAPCSQVTTITTGNVCPHHTLSLRHQGGCEASQEMFCLAKLSTDSKSSEPTPPGAALPGNGCHGTHTVMQPSLSELMKVEELLGEGCFFLPPPCA